MRELRRAFSKDLSWGGAGVKLFLIINFNIILNQCQINILIKNVVSKFCGKRGTFIRVPFPWFIRSISGRGIK